MIFFSQLSEICEGSLLQLSRDHEIEELITDSRKALLSERSLFFAIMGERHDGHAFIEELYSKGIRQFVIERPLSLLPFEEANFFLAPSSIKALQQLAAHHRASFPYAVIGITGSNGKTIIKEWLYQLLSPDYKVVKNPGSYNSQIGVALSVWQMQQHHELGIFEAGISKSREMAALQEIIQPTLGIFTNIGTAHDQGFPSIHDKINEKLTLFSGVDHLVYCSDHSLIRQAIKAKSIPALGWGFSPPADLLFTLHGRQVQFSWKGVRASLKLPFSDAASVENCLHCVVTMLLLNSPVQTIQERITFLKNVPMRLELKQGVNQCQIIDDSYNNDLAGLRISLNFLSGIQKKKKTLILSDILQSGLAEVQLSKTVCDLIMKSDVTRFIGVGPVFSANQNAFQSLAIPAQFFSDTTAAIQNLSTENFQQEVILVKGARKFSFEKLVAHLQQKVHGTRMEIDLNKLVHNLNFFKSQLQPGVKLMVMVKAFAYGSGSEEVASVLQYQKVDYLGVAYADEGVELRKNHIHLPIMVMNATEESYPLLTEYKLEPVIYSISMLTSFVGFLNGKPATIHLEVETGMRRLGLEETDLPQAIQILKANSNLRVASLFSHLAAADEGKHDPFTKVQVSQFNKAYELFSSQLGIKPIRHVLNSSGIIRFPQYQMDMVRLGIGLYGVNPTEQQVAGLKPVATLKTIISQIKKVAAGETIGYGRHGLAKEEMTLATIAIGYADGFSRRFSKGVGCVLINGKKAPVAGNVCMDMTMVDITGIEAKEGDEVIVFGEGMPIEEVAQRGNTIPYEILTNTSERVKRIFYTEG
jgi:Alr-MurF fusion protein